jgi:hypothetical protein
MQHKHIPVPVFEERRGDQSLTLQGYACALCSLRLPMFEPWPQQAAPPTPEPPTMHMPANLLADYAFA